MSRVDFAYGARHRLRAACRTAARHAQSGQRVLVYCPDDHRLQRFDDLLWGFDPVSFITHACVGDPQVEQAQVILARSGAELGAFAQLPWLLNLDLDCPPEPERFERILEIVSNHDTDKQAARARWVQYQAAGFDVRGHPFPQEP